MSSANKIMLTAFPAAMGLCLAWFGATLIKNEKQILHRNLELKMALKTRSRRERRKLLLGN